MKVHPRDLSLILRALATYDKIGNKRKSQLKIITDIRRFITGSLSTNGFHDINY